MAPATSGSRVDQLTLDLGIDELLAGYRAAPDTYDEMIDAAGRPRAHWRPVLAAFSAMGRDEVERRFAIANAHLKASGVFYRVYGDAAGTERAWPLAPVPVVLPQADWRALAAGVVERAELLETVLADVYGEGRLLRDGAVPAALVAGSSEFLRPLAGVRPAGGRHLRLYAVDVTRAPDGRWWILADRTQAPSGAGYAVENRIALSRALPELTLELNVERLAGFFQDVRDGLSAATGQDAPRVALMTPGPANETYFEHAYLARYLGFLLVEGGDLIAADGALHVRTVEGPQRIDALMRRVDSDFVDPLELNASSRLGVPGLVDVIRRGRLVTANAVGSGVVETPALLALLPALARRVLGRDLALPNLATWWCGDPIVAAEVRAELDRLTLAPAFGPRLQGLLDDGAVFGGDLDAATRARLLDRLERRGVDLVGQEAVRLSTTPVWEAGRLVPKPFALRVFVAATEKGYAVMPGGLARISDRADARALSMQRGGRSADVWIAAEAPVAARTLLPSPDDVPVRRTAGTLPSRAADNLYWLGRYVARAETTMRVVRRLVARPADADEASDLAGSAGRRLADLLVAWGAARSGSREVIAVAAEAMTRPGLGGSVPDLIVAARRTASNIRDRLAQDAWVVLDDLASRLAGDDTPEPDAAVCAPRTESGLRLVAAFAGLAQENMNRIAGWRFLDLGLRIERAIGTCRLVRRLTDPAAPPLCLDMLLDLADSQITYRSRYLMGTSRRAVIDLVVLDAANPRAVAYQVERLREHLAALAERAPEGVAGDTVEAAAELARLVATTAPEAVADAWLTGVENRLMALSDALVNGYVAQRGARRGRARR